MKTQHLKSTLVVLTGLLYAFSCSAQKVTCEQAAVEAELAERLKADQDIRFEMIPVAMEYQKSGEGKFKLLTLYTKMSSIDSDNQDYVDTLTEQCGWSDGLSAEAHNTIFMIIQHADIDYINKHLDEVRKKAEAGLLAKDDYAIMLDRKNMNEGREQLFGSQTFQAADGISYVWPVARMETLTQRRDSLGLPPMEDYMKLAKDSLGVEMVWDKALTLEKAKGMRNE